MPPDLLSKYVDLLMFVFIFYCCITDYQNFSGLKQHSSAHGFCVLEVGQILAGPPVRVLQGCNQGVDHAVPSSVAQDLSPNSIRLLAVLYSLKL